MYAFHFFVPFCLVVLPRFFADSLLHILYAHLGFSLSFFLQNITPSTFLCVCGMKRSQKWGWKGGSEGGEKESVVVAEEARILIACEKGRESEISVFPGIWD